MFKEGVLSRALGRMSGVPVVYIREVSHSYGSERTNVPSRNQRGNTGEVGQEVTSCGVMVEVEGVLT